MKRLVKIQHADGLIKTYDMALLTIDDMNCIAADGGVVIEYINE